MLYGFIGRVSTANELKQGLDVSSQRTRLIADRVAKATLSGADGFAASLEQAQGLAPTGEEPIDLEQEMVALADEQLRYETAARLLQRAYQNIRTSLRDRQEMTTPINGAGGVAGVETRPLFRTLAISASGMSAQRARLEAIASNIANAETTRTEDGTPYRRRIVQLAAAPPRYLPGGPAPTFQMPTLNPADAAHGVLVAGVAEDGSEGPLVYDPGHPDADEAGYVRYPNVSITEEMVDLLSARRVYEANVTVFQSTKAMLRRALEI